jgi:hypothetical protein
MAPSKKTTTQRKNMIYKIIIALIEELTRIASSKGNSGEFNRDMDNAIKALKTIKKYF